MTENNRFVTVAFLLIFDCEDAEEEIFCRAEDIQSEDRNFTEKVLDFPYKLIAFRIMSFSLRKSFQVIAGTNYTFGEDYIVSYATEIFNASHFKSHYNYTRCNCQWILSVSLSLSLSLALILPLIFPLFS